MYRVVGIKDVNFKAKDGTEVKGLKLFVTYDDEKVEGVGTDSFFLSDNRQTEFGYLPILDDEIEIRYNRFGSIAGVDVLKSKALA